jgi:two-component system phosphate regulon sensor histidine kinase PhoR
VPRRRLLWQLLPVVLLLVAAALLVTASTASRSIRHLQEDLVAEELGERGEVARETLTPLIVRADRAAIAAAVESMSATASTRLTVVGRDGLTIAESHPSSSIVVDHSVQPEVASALSGRPGSSVRERASDAALVLYVALPITDAAGEVAAVLRLAEPLTGAEPALAWFRARLAVSAAVLFALAAFASWLVSRRVARPLEKLRETAERFARGELSARPPGSGYAEIDDLSAAMVRMAEELADRIDALARHTGEQERVLSSMVEGVLAVDRTGHVMTLNRAAAALVGTTAVPETLGRSLEEVVRNPEIQRFVGDALRADAPCERDLTVHGSEPRQLQAHGAPIRTVRGERLGAVVVLNDVTQLRRLEAVRKDFVANVSHELKTPITSIKASVETLLSGALDDEANAQRFLEIISRQSDRLATIIEDLLSLSRIEQETDSGGIVLKQAPVRDVLVAAVDACRLTADTKKLRIRTDCAGDLRARLNAALLEQAVINLIDNAIKYSEPGASVEVGAEQVGSRVRLSVRDHGAGIEEGHLERLFERFYRVDKARSRRLGGTGLGLAIVKHIAQAHGGSVSVDSQPGAGSTFTIELPAG